jgi:glycosyltransferase involved in cell wall biosynthesis
MMRIGCYALVERDAGSVASANYLLLEELLRRGHAVDLFAIEGYVEPEGLDAYPRYRYRGFRSDRADRLWAAIPKRLHGTAGALVGRLVHRLHLDEIASRVREENAREPYDVFLFLGVPAQFDVAPLATVAWVQGPPQTEWAALRALRSQVIALCGAGLYLKLKAFYAMKHRAARREMARAAAIVCGSRWARERIVEFGVDPARVHALPYPIDLDLFAPAPLADGHAGGASGERRITFLWLGRIDPRKRLDLLLDAFALLLEERTDVHLHVVGRVGYAAGYRRLLEGFAFPHHLTVTEQIPRGDVPDLLRAADVLVQTSESENFGSAVAEAMACGRPAVVGPTNGTREYLRGAGYHFAAYTPEDVCAALAAAAHDAANADRSLREHARLTAQQTFGVPRVTGVLEQILARAAAAPAGAVRAAQTVEAAA